MVCNLLSIMEVVKNSADKGLLACIVPSILVTLHSITMFSLVGWIIEGDTVLPTGASSVGHVFKVLPCPVQCWSPARASRL